MSWLEDRNGTAAARGTPFPPCTNQRSTFHQRSCCSGDGRSAARAGSLTLSVLVPIELKGEGAGIAAARRQAQPGTSSARGPRVRCIAGTLRSFPWKMPACFKEASRSRSSGRVGSSRARSRRDCSERDPEIPGFSESAQRTSRRNRWGGYYDVLRTSDGRPHQCDSVMSRERVAAALLMANLQATIARWFPLDSVSASSPQGERPDVREHGRRQVRHVFLGRHQSPGT